MVWSTDVPATLFGPRTEEDSGGQERRDLVASIMSTLLTPSLPVANPGSVGVTHVSRPTGSWSTLPTPTGGVHGVWEPSPFRVGDEVPRSTHLSSKETSLTLVLVSGPCGSLTSPSGPRPPSLLAQGPVPAAPEVPSEPYYTLASTGGGGSSRRARGGPLRPAVAR